MESSGEHEVAPPPLQDADEHSSVPPLPSPGPRSSTDTAAAEVPAAAEVEVELQQFLPPAPAAENPSAAHVDAKGGVIELTLSETTSHADQYQAVDSGDAAVGEATLADVSRDPTSWSLYASPEGYPYYYNHKTGQSLWAPYSEEDAVQGSSSSGGGYYGNASSADGYSASYYAEQAPRSSPARSSLHRRVERREDAYNYDHGNYESGRLVDDDRYAIREDLFIGNDAEQYNVPEVDVEEEEEAYGGSPDEVGSSSNSRSLDAEDDVEEEAFLAYLNSPEGQLALEEEKRLIEEQASELLKQRLKDGMKSSSTTSSAWGQRKLKDDSQDYDDYDNRRVYPSIGSSSQRRGGLGGSEDVGVHRRHNNPNAAMQQQEQPYFQQQQQQLPLQSQQSSALFGRRQYPVPYQAYTEQAYENDDSSLNYKDGGRGRRRSSSISKKHSSSSSSNSRRRARRKGAGSGASDDDVEIGTRGDDEDTGARDADLSSSDSDVEEIIAPTIPDIPASEVLSTVLVPIQSILGQLLGTGTYYTRELLRRLSTDGAVTVGALSQQAFYVSSNVIDRSIGLIQQYGAPLYSTLNESVVHFIETNLANLTAPTSSQAGSGDVSDTDSVAATECAPPADRPQEAAPSYSVRELNAAMLGDDTMVSNRGGASV